MSWRQAVQELLENSLYRSLLPPRVNVLGVLFALAEQEDAT